MNITLSGDLGSGKSSVCRELEKAGYKIISAGSIFRGIAEEKGMTVVELNEWAQENDEIDTMIDERSAALSEVCDNTVFDSRMAWYFVKNSFKVFLMVDIDEAARRVYEDQRRNAESYASVEEAKDALLARTISEEIRFWELYQVNYRNEDNYDLIIDTTCMTPVEVGKLIIEGVRDREMKRGI